MPTGLAYHSCVANDNRKGCLSCRDPRAIGPSCNLGFIVWSTGAEERSSLTPQYLDVKIRRVFIHMGVGAVRQSAAENPGFLLEGPCSDFLTPGHLP